MEWTQEIKEVFWKFKKTFYDALILQQFNPANPNILQGDTRAYTFTAILYQYDGLGTLRPVYFYSPQCYPATQNYDTDDKALFKIVDTMKQWWDYLEGANHRILIQCKHKYLEYYQTSIVLSQRQAWRVKIVSSCDFVIELVAGNRKLARWTFLTT